VLATGPGNPPAVRVWPAKTGRFGSRPVQKPDLLRLGRPTPDPYPSTRGFCRVWLDPSVTMSGSAFRVFQFMVISNNPSFRLKHPGVPDSSDGSGGTSYTLTENQTPPVAQATGRVAYIPCGGYYTMPPILGTRRVVYHAGRSGVRLPLLCVRNVVRYTHYRNNTYVTLFAGVQKTFPSGRNASVRVDALRQSRQRHPGGGLLSAQRQYHASRSISPSHRRFGTRLHRDCNAMGDAAKISPHVPTTLSSRSVGRR